MSRFAKVPDPARRRRFWFDPRFAVGLALVLASVLGVTLLVATADRTEAVYAANSPLAVGDRVYPADLAISHVRLGASEKSYVRRGAVPKAGFIVTRTVSEGELLPAAAVGSIDGVTVSSVVVDTRGRLPRAVAAGEVVDVWSAREVENGLYGPPGVLVPSATVVRVLEPEGLLAQDVAASVELLVPKDRVARVLESLANSDAISLVPVNRPLGG
ncbi:hypothetical protein [Planctomonas psychrotolerans]|uniref:hypothetical protein n=1 Tax=Planctomonas psychrotolerans TaxID=2528712 RepID=UPI001238E0A3|nr:hypothetical protein [Planctomonas psychrotolerans]